jgi:hypothetical protein
LNDLSQRQQVCIMYDSRRKTLLCICRRILELQARFGYADSLAGCKILANYLSRSSSLLVAAGSATLTVARLSLLVFSDDLLLLASEVAADVLLRIGYRNTQLGIA